jgi:hypothetical protein
MFWYEFAISFQTIITPSQVAKSVEHWVAGQLVRGGRFCGRYGILGQLHQVSQRGSFCFLGQRTVVPTRADPTAPSICSDPMIDSLIGACETLVSAVSGNGKHPSSRISRAGMPNGLLGILGEEFALQVQWSIDSDYRHELETYHRETLNLRRQDPVHGQFGVLIGCVATL